MKNDLLLVRLPRIEGVIQDFYGIGYYSDHGFVFLLITEDLINSRPLRSFPFPKETTYDSASQFEIIGQIKDLKRDEK
jgi:hypothetical protein